MIERYLANLLLLIYTISQHPKSKSRCNVTHCSGIFTSLEALRAYRYFVGSALSVTPERGLSSPSGVACFSLFLPNEGIGLRLIGPFKKEYYQLRQCDFVSIAGQSRGFIVNEIAAPVKVEIPHLLYDLHKSRSTAIARLFPYCVT